MVWGITIAIAIYATRNLSCAHFNPAVSIAMCVGKPGDMIFPLFIGLTITMGICTVGPMTDAGFNPARDIMPRIVACVAGADQAMVFEPGVLVIYVIAPIIGGIVGALLWMYWLEPLHKQAAEA